ncbi:uncharacterized protein LOC143217809 [Lasioglossum baleicum]|uniref:uncharacterized protein LOC143217809 n=1 Tax=Lasioglossum baleicum TaxID=434251 RepID=UPI003FCE9A7D
MRKSSLRPTKRRITAELQRRNLPVPDRQSGLQRSWDEIIRAQTEQLFDMATAKGDPAPGTSGNDKPRNTDTTDESFGAIQMRKSGCTTDGKDPYAFLERVSELRRTFRLSDRDLLLGIPELLRGDAQDWYRNNEDQIASWAVFSEKFLAFFTPLQTRLQKEREARARTQRPGEPFHLFLNALLTKLRRAQIPKDEHLETAYENMLPDYAMLISSDSLTDLDDLLRQVQRIEMAIERKTKMERTGTNPVATATLGPAGATPETPGTRNTNRPTATMNPRPLMHQTPTNSENPGDYSPVTHCWRCKQRGHVRFECRNKYRKFCSRCGRDGVLTRECHPPGNGMRGPQPMGEYRPPQ